VEVAIAKARSLLATQSAGGTARKGENIGEEDVRMPIPIKLTIRQGFPTNQSSAASSALRMTISCPFDLMTPSVPGAREEASV
jgi:hypothetical protein